MEAARAQSGGSTPRRSPTWSASRTSPPRRTTLEDIRRDVRAEAAARRLKLQEADKALRALRAARNPSGLAVKLLLSTASQRRLTPTASAADARPHSPRDVRTPRRRLKRAETAPAAPQGTPRTSSTPRRTSAMMRTMTACSPAELRAADARRATQAARASVREIDMWRAAVKMQSM